jgi:hypothetical protein
LETGPYLSYVPLTGGSRDSISRSTTDASKLKCSANLENNSRFGISVARSRITAILRRRSGASPDTPACPSFSSLLPTLLPSLELENLNLYAGKRRARHPAQPQEPRGEGRPDSRGSEANKKPRYSELVRSDQLGCGSLAGRWPLVSALPPAAMGGPRLATSPAGAARWAAEGRA